MSHDQPNWIVQTPPLGDSSKRTANTEFVTLAVAAAATGSAGFASGTRILFQQTAAPTGWTKDTTFNDTVLRIVSGAAGTGGSNAFSTVNAQTVVGNTTLTTTQIPSHTHGYTAGGAAMGTPYDAGVTFTPGAPGAAATTGAAGGGGSHNHTITFNILYVDAIICQKD